MARKPRPKIDNPDRYLITRVKGNKKKNLHIFDTVTKKQISYQKFEKIFDLTETELFHLKSDHVSRVAKGKKQITDSGKTNLTEYFKYFEKNRNFSFLIDVNNLSDIEKYKIKYAKKKLSFSELQEKIYYYLEHIERSYYVFKLKVNVIKGEAHLVLRYEIINHQHEEVNSYTDEDGNFILFNS